MNDALETNRRRWLLGSGATLASALGAGSVGNLLLNAKPAFAADYKALVCIFLYGGNDGMNMIVP
ncbi:MAG: Tat pathway signal protein, partial [Burkholderiales bacterium]